MALKLLAYGYKFYFVAWNVFDFIIVTVSLAELLFPLPVNPTVVRLFRLFRLARMLRYEQAPATHRDTPRLRQLPRKRTAPWVDGQSTRHSLVY